MLNSINLERVLRINASHRTAQHFLKSVNFKNQVAEVVNTLAALSLNGYVAVGNRIYHASEYSLTDNMRIFIENARVYMSPSDSARTQPIVFTQLTVDSKVDFMSPTDFSYFFKDYNEEQGERISVQLDTSQDDKRIPFTNVSNIVVNEAGLRLPGEKSLEEASILHGYVSNLDLAPYVNKMTPFAEDEVVEWLLS